MRQGLTLAGRVYIGTSSRNCGEWREAALRDQGQPPRHAIEFRHESRFDAEVAGCLQAYGIANCQSGPADWPLWDAVTTDMVYLRLHGHTLTCASGYSDTQLRAWAGKIRRRRRKGCEVHVYFDNDAFGCAPFDAPRLMKFTGTARN